jgi:aryl-alcohol dehydrogenase-like predicted oxidoreductase
MKSLATSEKYGWARYVAHQVYYSLLGREYEWELLPLGVDQKVGALVWSPLGWGRLTEDCPTMAALLATKDRIREATRTYLDSLTEGQLNTTLATRPMDWGGELRSPAFILLHVITHAFHHKGQVVAMLRILGYPAPDTDLQPV